MNYGSAARGLDPVQAKRILRQVAVMGDRYGLGDQGIALLEKALEAGFNDDNTMSGLVFCLANNQQSDEALDRYRKAEAVLGGAEQSPSTFVAAIYANVKSRNQGKALQMLKYFETTCVPYLKEDTRGNYVSFLDLIKEYLNRP